MCCELTAGAGAIPVKSSYNNALRICKMRFPQLNVRFLIGVIAIVAIAMSTGVGLARIFVYKQQLDMIALSTSMIAYHKAEGNAVQVIVHQEAASAASFKARQELVRIAPLICIAIILFCFISIRTFIFLRGRCFGTNVTLVASRLDNICATFIRLLGIGLLLGLAGLCIIVFVVVFLFFLF